MDKGAQIYFFQNCRYLEEHRGWRHVDAKDCGVFMVHIGGCGVLWRYTKLLIKPLALTNVKCEMRNLCILRLVLEILPFKFVVYAPDLIMEC